MSEQLASKQRQDMIELLLATGRVAHRQPFNIPANIAFTEAHKAVFDAMGQPVPPTAVNGLRSMCFMPYGTHVDLVVSFDSIETAQAARENFTSWALSPRPAEPPTEPSSKQDAMDAFDRLNVDLCELFRWKQEVKPLCSRRYVLRVSDERLREISGLLNKLADAIRTAEPPKDRHSAIQAVIAEMIQVAASESDGVMDEWTADNCAQIDAWQVRLADAISGHQPPPACPHCEKCSHGCYRGRSDCLCNASVGQACCFGPVAELAQEITANQQPMDTADATILYGNLDALCTTIEKPALRPLCPDCGGHQSTHNDTRACQTCKGSGFADETPATRAPEVCGCPYGNCTCIET